MRAFAGTAAVAVPARFAQLAMTLLLAPRLGPEGFGLFVFAQGFSQLAARLGALGWPTLVLRMIPKFETEADWRRLAGITQAALWVGLVSGVVVAFATYGIAAAVEMDPNLALGLSLGALILPAMALRTITRNMLAGYKYPARGVFLDELLPPLLTCLIVVIIGVSAADMAVKVYGIASALAVGYGFWALRGIRPGDLAGVTPVYEMRAWMAIALPALVGMSAKLIMNRTDVVMLAPLADLEEVARYAVALKVTFVQTFPVVVLSAVLGPRLSAAITAGKQRVVERLYFGGLAFAGVFAVAMGLILILWRAPIMVLLFGPDYAGSAPVLAVLALAQIAAALGIPATSFMIMAGREKLFGVVTVAALALNLGLNFVLIPLYGAIGAAVATACSATVLTGFQIGVGVRGTRAMRQGGTDAT